MTLTEILEELPKRTFMERQELMVALFHLDPPPVSADERVILKHG
jgi:hypothetical protein